MADQTKIDWTDATWNPVTGCHGPSNYSVSSPCEYCYARRMAKRLKAMGQHKYRNGFEPTFHPEELGRPSRWKKPRKIFVCSMADLFGDWVPVEWITAVIDAVRKSPQHTFQFLTKNPTRLSQFNPWPENAWVGATATDQTELVDAVELLDDAEASISFLSIEPILAPMTFPERSCIGWVIIGMMTGSSAKYHKFDPRWVTKLSARLRRLSIPVFHKENLGELATSFEFPEVIP